VNDFADCAILFRISRFDGLLKLLRTAVGAFLDLLTFFRSFKQYWTLPTNRADQSVIFCNSPAGISSLSPDS
jgi:hypothetical protein